MKSLVRRSGMIKNIPVMIVLSALLISGCSLYSSNIKELSGDVPPSYSKRGEVHAPPVGRWWEQFDDPGLNTLMEEAFEHNLDIVQAYERLQQSLALADITNASRGPVVNIEGSGGRARQSGIPGTITSETYRLSAAASYEIDLFGKLTSKTAAARYDVLASEQDLRGLYITLSARLADLYYLAIEQRAQLELSDNTIASFQDTMDRVERRYREGLVPAIDLYQSRQNLYTAKAQRPLFEQTLTTTLNALSVLAGRFPDMKSGGSIKELQNAPAFPVGIPSDLLVNRPDIRAAYLRLAASDQRIGAAIADRFPSFNLVGSYGGASDRIRTVLDSPNILWNILLQAAQPVLDSGRRKAEVMRSKSVFRENLADYHGTVLNAFKEVEDALARSSASEKRITMLRETVAASDRSLQLALDRYLQGLTDYLPVLTEQLRNTSAQSNLLTVKRQLISDRIQLVRALGGEWVDGEREKYESSSEKLLREKI